MAADRFVLKQFAGSATNNGAFGAAQATGVGVQPVADIKDVQSLSAFEQGWNAATLTADKLPALEEMQGLEALLCKALKENYSEGIPFWIAGETYFQYSFVNYNGVLYYNTTGSYTNNNPAIDTANWAAYNKVGTATVGTDDTPIYLNVGTPTAGKRMGVVAYDNTKTYNLDDVVLNVDSSGAVVLYLSLAANNTSALTDTTKWKQVSLGGGAGGEIGDMGFAPLGIDESLNLRRYLNGQVISQDLSPSFTNKVKEAITLHPSLGTTEASWQSELAASKIGQCGKFVIDDVNNTIRLPAVVNAQGLLSLSGIGNLVNESLPNIKESVPSSIMGDFGAPNGSGSVFEKGGTTTYKYGGGSYGVNSGFDFDVSRKYPTYQNNAPVQQEAVQYPYYIQVATGVEETLPAIREYKVNNSDFFGKSMYSDVAPDNASYLASNGQYNARTVYPDYYDWLLEKRNSRFTTFYGLNNALSGNLEALIPSSSVAVNDLVYTRLNSTAAIVLGYVTSISGTQISYHNNANGATGTLVLDTSHTESLYKYSNITPNILLQEEASNWPSLLPNTTDYDFVINTSDQTFRLPLLNGEENWVGNTSQTLSTADIVLGTPFTWTATQNGFITFTCYRANQTQSVITQINGQMINFSGTGTTTTTPRLGFWLKVKKGDVVSIAAEYDTLTNVGIAFIPAVGNGTLYYYVGDTVQDASLINAGAVLGQLANKANISLSNIDATGQAKFDVKADIDASNFNATGKETIVGWGMPDYSAVVTYGTSMTTPAAGWVRNFMAIGNGGTGTLTISGVEVWRLYHVGDRGVAGSYGSGLIKVPAGVPVVSSGGNVYFYPNKDF